MKIQITKIQIGKILAALRTDKDMPQAELAAKLGIPRSAVSQIENGSRDLSFIEMQQILQIFGISYEEFAGYLEFKKRVTINTSQPINKNIEFNSEKFKQLFLYILEKCGSKPNVGETVIYKLLYFCDFDFFEIKELPLTGMKYKKMQFGPVPDQSMFLKVIREMRENGMIERLTRSYLGNTMQTKYINFAPADLSCFNFESIKIIDAVINRLSDMSARQIEDHSHADHPWQAASDNEEIDYSSVFSRTGEFAQKDYEQMWRNASSKDILLELGEINQEENNYYLNLLNNNG